jgi:predicted metal-dependent phosphoesterase TrpH
VEDVIDFARERGGVVVAAHPFRAYGLGESSKNYDLDAIEVLNGASALEVNKLAEILARDMSLPGVAGTDAHKVDELWTVYTEIQASFDVDEILKAIKKGLVRAVSTEKSIRF